MCSSVLLTLEDPTTDTPNRVIHSKTTPLNELDHESLLLCRFHFSDTKNHGLHFFGHFHRRANSKTDCIRIFLAQRIILSIIIQFVGFAGGGCIIDFRLYRVRFNRLNCLKSRLLFFTRFFFT